MRLLALGASARQVTAALPSATRSQFSPADQRNRACRSAGSRNLLLSGSMVVVELRCRSRRHSHPLLLQKLRIRGRRGRAVAAFWAICPGLPPCLLDEGRVPMRCQPPARRRAQAMVGHIELEGLGQEPLDRRLPLLRMPAGRWRGDGSVRRSAPRFVAALGGRDRRWCYWNRFYEPKRGHARGSRNGNGFISGPSGLRGKSHRNNSGPGHPGCTSARRPARQIAGFVPPSSEPILRRF